MSFDEFLNNPVVQSSIVPFAVGLLALVILRRMGWMWAGLSAVIGFYAAVYLIHGFDWLPLRSNNKIMWLGLGAVVVGLALDLYPGPRKPVLPLLFVAGAAAVVWLIWPKLSRMEGLEWLLLAASAAVYGGWMVASFDGLRDKPLTADSALLALALGVGLCAVFGASASYGQLASAIAAAVGARWLLHVLGKGSAVGALGVLPLAMLCAAFSFGAYVYANMPWYVLPLLALIPLLARVPLAGMPAMALGVVTVFVCGLPAAISVYLTREAAGGLLY